MSPEKEIARQGYADPVFFCRYFLPHYFPSDLKWFQRGLLAVLLRRADFLAKYGELDKIASNFVWSPEPEDPSAPTYPVFDFSEPLAPKMSLSRYTLVMIPRGFSKTTICGVAVPVMNAVYQDTDFLVYVSETGPHAKMQLDNVKRELEGNERIIKVFGLLKPDRNDAQRWAADQFETTTGVAMVARGRGGQIRGLLHRASRPRKIIVDDVEDKESVLTEEQRLKTREWAYGDLMPALPALDPTATITAVGTLLHPDALLRTWYRDPEWTSVVFGARDRQGELLWPEMFDERRLERVKDSYVRAGLLHVFYMEYFNQVSSTESAKFRYEMFRYEPAPMDQLISRAIFLDPAISGKVGADRTAIHVGGMAQKGIIYHLDYWTKVGATPRETIERYFELSAKWNCDHHGVESNAYQAALVHLMREEMFRKKRYFEITPVHHHQRKDERILGILQPRYANGYIVHTRRVPELEAELIDYPRGKKDNADAWAGCIALLDPYAAAAAGDVDLAEDEYPPLEEVLGAGFRRY